MIDSKRFRNIFAAASAAILLTMTIPAPAAADPVDYRIYAGLLDKYVHDGVVDYAGFQKDIMAFEDFLDILARVDAATLNRNEQLAFYINVYNAWTIKLITMKFPNIRSIKDVKGFLGLTTWGPFGSPWKLEIVRLKGVNYTLDQIEHDIIRKTFQDPRIHFALNCAAKGCPPLLSRPFLGSTIDRQLDEVTKAFVNDPARTRLDAGVLYLNKVFDWYGEDFGDKAGFVKKYAEPSLRQRLEAGAGGVEIRYLKYDWSLNKS